MGQWGYKSSNGLLSIPWESWFKSRMRYTPATVEWNRLLGASWKYSSFFRHWRFPPSIENLTSESCQKKRKPEHVTRWGNFFADSRVWNMGLSMSTLEGNGHALRIRNATWTALYRVDVIVTSFFTNLRKKIFYYWAPRGIGSTERSIDLIRLPARTLQPQTDCATT